MPMAPRVWSSTSWKRPPQKPPTSTPSALVASPALAAGPVYGPPRLDALITEGSLDEISGVAASRRTDDLFWVHNDAPRPATLVALDGKGRIRGRLTVDGVRAIDLSASRP